MEDHIMTVRGPIGPDELGPTSMHDHVFWDASEAWWLPDSFEEPELTDSRFDAHIGALPDGTR
ncbi:MAG: hypothetical protein U0V56_05365 [Actinomycetota bacterium]